MTFAKHLTPSERYARRILRAWYEGDLAEFETALKNDPHSGASSVGLAEQERMDLVQDLAGRFPAWEQSSQREDAASLDAALQLTRRLARWDERR